MTLHINEFFDEVTRVVLQSRHSEIRETNDPIVIEGPDIRAYLTYSGFGWNPTWEHLKVVNNGYKGVFHVNERKTGIPRWVSDQGAIHRVVETIKATMKPPVIDYDWDRPGFWAID